MLFDIICNISLTKTFMQLTRLIAETQREMKIHPIYYFFLMYVIDLIVSSSSMHVFCMKIAATYVITNNLVITTHKYIINVIKCS